MKKMYALILLLSITATSFTQIKKGQFLAGGSISFESIKDENSRYPGNESKNFLISPDIGYFIVDKLAGGIRINFGSSHSKSSDADIRYTSSSISPFLRYYFLPLPKKVNAFIDISYLHTKTKWRHDSDPAYFERAKGYCISAGPSIFLTNQVALEFTVGYKNTHSDNFGNTIVNTFNSGFALQIHLGKIRNKQKI